MYHNLCILSDLNYQIWIITIIHFSNFTLIYVCMHNKGACILNNTWLVKYAHACKICIDVLTLFIPILYVKWLLWITMACCIRTWWFIYHITISEHAQVITRTHASMHIPACEITFEKWVDTLSGHDKVSMGIGR